jgi:hypothetical protein
MAAVRPKRSERGFVLIAAIWLLILAGSIAAILMLRSLANATAAADHQEEAARRLALESATETVLADRLFNGNRSAWWLAPAQGRMILDGHDIVVRLSSESGRIDVNAADPKLVDSALNGFGVSATERGRIVDRLLALRVTKRRINSLPELEALFAYAERSGGPCLPDHFTFASALTEPRLDQISSELAHALGIKGAGTTSATVEGGAALRIEAAEVGRSPLVSIARISGLAERPLETIAWAAPAPCAGRI